MYRLIRRIEDVKSKFQVFMSGVICQIEILIEERLEMEDDILFLKNLKFNSPQFCKKKYLRII